MTTAFDDRIMNLQVMIEGQTITYDQNYYMVAVGARYANGTFGECSLRIDNISKTDRDYIISKTTLWSKERSTVAAVLNVGRKSYGTFEIFRGGVITANITQPPDIGLTMTCAVGAAIVGYVQSFAMPPSSTLRSICQQVANNLTAADPTSPVVLDFQSKQGDKQIANFSCNGPVTNQVIKLQELASITAHNNNGKLTILDIGDVKNVPIVLISKETGMIGVPEITSLGIRVRCLILNNLSLGTPVQVVSKINPLANGTFYVYKMQFEIASRDTPFYWVLELTAPNATPGYHQ